MCDNWGDLISEEQEKDYFRLLMMRIQADEASLSPDRSKIFRAFMKTGLADVKVVILGQDPYPKPGKATGLAFGTPADWTPVNSSLLNVINEAARTSYGAPDGITLEGWAEQGVLLLNTRLTCLFDKPLSHKGIGWEPFVDRVVSLLNQQNRPIVWMLWGNEARSYSRDISNPNHLILQTTHPCRYSARRGFIGSNHFSRANQYLKEKGIKEVDWSRSLSFANPPKSPG